MHYATFNNISVISWGSVYIYIGGGNRSTRRKPPTCRKSLTTLSHNVISRTIHWGKADDRNCNYGHPKMADVESGKNLFCRLNCFYNVF